MRIILALIFTLFCSSCDKDPIFGLERGWLRSNEDRKNHNEDTQSIQIIKPNGGESWDIGDTKEIKWQSEAPTSQMISIQLYKGSNFMENIDSQINNDEKFEWYIPSDLEEDNDYRVRIFFSNNTQIEDFSDEYFTIENDQ